MSALKATTHAKRGRPPKFGLPSQVVALTLPEETIRRLRATHPDLGWAIVTLVEKRSPADPIDPVADAQLVTIDDHHSLIVVNRAVFKRLPGVNIIPLNANQAFLALEPGQGLEDLELAALDRLDDPAVHVRERKAVQAFRLQLKRWRQDRALRFHYRAIIVVERVSDNRKKR